MAPSNEFEPTYHSHHDSDEDNGFSEYEKELFLDEEEQSLPRGSRPQMMSAILLAEFKQCMRFFGHEGDEKSTPTLQV